MKKLVRDNIPQITTNKKATFYTADIEEYKQRLRAKLQEEVDEYLQDNNLEELADILEVVYALACLDGHCIESLEDTRKEKAQRNGAFLKRIILELK